uniref:uncharacterized protein LOC105349327 n=1 Tax=Fragaria vesca subsp. vesca TaxID=101020 RepID=UPI0005C9AA16|nr:PREDICTED: uncharacterized protein LOC105349327 [Fragaria vesca subsp. vesca]
MFLFGIVIEVLSFIILYLSCFFWNFCQYDEFILSQEYSISSRRNPVARRRGQRSLRRPEHDEKSNSKGTTIFGFRYNNGVVLGGDGRIYDYDYYYDNNNNKVSTYFLVQDDKKKTFELLNTNNSRICCACMGLVDYWEDLHRYLKKQNPQSVSTATKVAAQYMTNFVTEKTKVIEDYRNKHNEELSFGIILGGL